MLTFCGVCSIRIYLYKCVYVADISVTHPLISYTVHYVDNLNVVLTMNNIIIILQKMY